MGAAIHKMKVAGDGGGIELLSNAAPVTNSTANSTTVNFASIALTGDTAVFGITMESESDSSARISSVLIDPGGADIAATELISIHATATDTIDTALFVADISGLSPGSYTVRVTFVSPGADSCSLKTWCVSGLTTPGSAVLTRTGTWTTSSSSVNISSFSMSDGQIAFGVIGNGSGGSSGFTWDTFTNDGDGDTGGATDDHTSSFGHYFDARSAAVEGISWTLSASKGSACAAVLE